MTFRKPEDTRTQGMSLPGYFPGAEGTCPPAKPAREPLFKASDSKMYVYVSSLNVEGASGSYRKSTG